MTILIAWPSILLGITVLLGVSKVTSVWRLSLSMGTAGSGGQLFLFVLGLLLLISGLAQVFSQGKESRSKTRRLL